MQSTSSEVFSFGALQSRLQEYEAAISDSGSERALVPLLLLMIIGSAVMTAGQSFLPNSWAVGAVIIGFALACIGILGAALFIILTIRAGWRHLRQWKADFTRDLERDFVMYEGVVAWVRSFDRRTLRTRLTYVKQRRERLIPKFGLMFGSLEKLGVLPILVALFLMSKDLSWPPQINPSPMAAYSALILVAFYGMSWIFALWRFRLDFFEQVLTDALAEDSYGPASGNREARELIVEMQQRE
jgi:hypothetical protein